MSSRLLPVVLFLGALAHAADSSAAGPIAQKVQVSHTDRFTLPSGGTLRLEHSFGELGIEGWDRQEVEITTVKSTNDFYAPADRAKAAAGLEKVHITSELRGKDVVVTTASPRHGIPGSPWNEPPIDLEYRIKAPIGASIAVDHGTGEIYFYGVSGDINARVRNGGITLDLPSGSQYSVDASSDWGIAASDFPGTPHGRFWLVGHQFTGKSSDGGHSLVLKAGYGDIIIFKTWKPEATQ